jgi:hypothetical protein
VTFFGRSPVAAHPANRHERSIDGLRNELSGAQLDRAPDRNRIERSRL